MGVNQIGNSWSQRCLWANGCMLRKLGYLIRLIGKTLDILLLIEIYAQCLFILLFCYWFLLLLLAWFKLSKDRMNMLILLKLEIHVLLGQLVCKKLTSILMKITQSLVWWLAIVNNKFLQILLKLPWHFNLLHLMTLNNIVKIGLISIFNKMR